MSKKTFKIHSSIYPKEILNQAVQAFEGYSITILSEMEILIEDENPQFVFDELMNYTLSIYSENIGAR